MSDENRIAIPAAHTQRDNTKVALEDSIPSRPNHKAVRIHCHSIRKRLVDPDAVSIKAVIDGLVEARVIADDTAEFVKEISFSQEKGSDEKTIITIDPVEQ